MKKLMLTVGSVVAIAAAAQAQQGSWYIGGNAGYNQTNQGVDKSGTKNKVFTSSEWTFSPEIGTFLTDNWQLGLGLNFNGYKNEELLTSEIVKGNRTGGTLYSRYFFGSGSFRPFLGVNVTVLPGSETYSAANVSDVKTKVMTWGANLNAGFAYALSPVVTAVGSFGALGFSSETTKQDGSDIKNYTQGFGFENAGTLGNRFTIGIYYTFLR
ncbi:MAG TPA: outer membrane beta-barrel protein [Edaphocola sp.]|nr:outer membrane beta-barrel protein [Edaphocola sp.]